MTGTQDQPPAERETGPEVPPLPQPVEDEQSGPVTLVPGPAAQDTPAWRPDPTPVTSGASRSTAYPSGPSTASPAITSFMSDVQRNGRWQVPPVLTITQGMSDVQLDLREAVITSPVVEIRLYAGMSSLTVIVPPGVQVEWAGGVSFMSEEKSDPPRFDDPSMWRLRILHHGVMNSVKVQTREVGETPPKSWRRT